jgi:pimeloyl-ACP methyl ester carboxylesterase
MAVVNDLQDRTLKLADGRTLAYRLCGSSEGFPTVLLHGAMGIGDFSVWVEDLSALAIHGIAPTLPGWGASSPKPHRSLRDYPNDIVQLLTSLNIAEQFDVVGISYGCVHAIAIAAALPLRVRRLGIFGPHPPFDDPHFNPTAGMALPSRIGLSAFSAHFPALGRVAARMVRNATSTPEKSESFMSKMLFSQLCDAEKKQLEEARAEIREGLLKGRGFHNSVATCVDGYAEIAAVLRSWSAADLGKVACATLVVGAREDVITPLRGAEYVAKGVGGSTLEVIDGGHLSHVLLFSRLLGEFAKLKPKGGGGV